VAKQRRLPGPLHGLWQVSYVTGRNVVIASSSWTTEIEHASGWRLEYDEADRAFALFAPRSDRHEAIVELPPGTGEVSLRLIDAATAWIVQNAADRGLPGLV
jgi:hypothetical protein